MNYKHKSLALTILNGEALAEGNIRLPAGTCIGVVTENAGTEPDIPVYISILDGGNEVVETMNQKFLKKTAGGRWTDSVMPMDFRCDRNVTVRLSTSAVVAADFTVDVLFIIKEESYV